MRNNNSNRNTPRPTNRNREEIDKDFGVLLLNTWACASLVVYTYDWERKAMWQTFRYQLPDIDISMKHVSRCVDIGRAMDQRFRWDRGFQIDFDLKEVADGISILMHIVTLNTDEGHPRYQMAARDDAGQFRMKDGKHVMVPATLTFERLIDQDRLQKLCDLSDDLMAAKLLRQIRQDLRARGDRKSLAELQYWLDFLKKDGEKAPVVPALTASAGEILAHKEGLNKKDHGQKPKIGAGKTANSPKENAVDPASDYVEQVFAAATPVAAMAPATDESSFAEVMTPVPVAATSPAPAPKPKQDKIGAASAPRPSLADQVAAVRNKIIPDTPDGSDGQQK